MTKKELALEVIRRLKAEYPDSECSLDYDDAWKLLVSVRLAAQCTDARVNLVTEELFEKYKTLEEFANADYEELSADIRPCGFFRTKAQNIIEMSKILLSKYNGEIPEKMEDLTELPGVGRKTANL